MANHILLYGVAIRDAIARSNLDEMRAFATVSASLLEEASDLEAADAEEWRTAHGELLASIAEAEGIELDPEDIVAIKDGIIVIDNIELARSLKPVLQSDLEIRWRVTVTIGN